MKRAGLLFFLLYNLTCAVHSSAQNRSLLHLDLIRSMRLWNPAEGTSVRIGQTTTPFILVFLSPECPMSVSYTLTLANLTKAFESTARVVAIIPGSTYADDRIVNFSKKYALPFPVYSDRKLQLTKKLNATVTPEAFLFNASGALVYSGAIDDWLQELGKKKTKPEQHYLRNALVQCLSGEPSLLSYVTPQGCLINDF